MFAENPRRLYFTSSPSSRLLWQPQHSICQHFVLQQLELHGAVAHSWLDSKSGNNRGQCDRSLQSPYPISAPDTTATTAQFDSHVRTCRNGGARQHGWRSINSCGCRRTESRGWRPRFDWKCGMQCELVCVCTCFCDTCGGNGAGESTNGLSMCI